MALIGDILPLPFLAAIFASLIAFGLIFYFWQAQTQKRARSEVKKRLDISRKSGRIAADGKTGSNAAAGRVARKLASRTRDYYSQSDPNQQKKMQMRLIQAGFAHPNALGYFLATRLALGLGFMLVGGVVVLLFYADKELTQQALMVMGATVTGYFLPTNYVARRGMARQQENRAGFPDVMDLMIVSAEAGLTIEASIERISQEISRTHPVLSEHLQVCSIEIRAGKQLDDALRSFGDRVGLEEVQGFATMIQQSKELGTSVSDALRVYSDEMRHKRMMAAEEKAYALPAKLSIPVTAFILPIVIGVAIIPTIVRLMDK
ncbi:MAG: type II secretion system F family protein [Nitratireductor sp.]|nr:type II secretion system F family protein [Nitratireductor sp.]